MKKIGIITISDYTNCGNRLQNYAVQQVLKKVGCEPETIQNINGIYNKNHKAILKVKIENITKSLSKKYEDKRHSNFIKFNKNIKRSKFLIDRNHIDERLNNYYDYFITGSDQVWNTNFERLSAIDLLEFASPNKRVAFAASFGVSELAPEYHERAKTEFLKFKNISVREDAGKQIVESLTDRKDVEVLVDPTMLLTAEDWDKVAKRPASLKTDKYILTYFLGQLSEQRKAEINRIAKENDCEVIDILDKQSPFYEAGPSEFLYLEKNAFLICTDSFHSSVFGIVYNRPFIIFEREDDNVSMNSRIETLISKLNLKNRIYKEKITEQNMNHDYSEAYKILEEERKKSYNFIKKSLEIK